VKIFLSIYWSLFVLAVMFIYGAVSHRMPSPRDHIVDANKKDHMPDAGKMVEEK
jgi:hypothetical protein